MPATGFVIGTTQAVDTLSGTTWTNPANAVVDSDTEATEAIATMNLPAAGSTSTGWLKLGNFGLDALIPANARIDKVEIQVRWRVNNAGGVANQEMCWAISGTRGTNAHTLATEPTTLTTTLSDVTAERAWTRADLLNAVFGVHVRGRNGNSATDPSYRFAWVKVQVTYSLPVTPTYTDIYDDFNRADGAVYAGAGAAFWEINRVDVSTPTNARVISNRLGLSAATYEQALSKQLMGLSGDYDLMFDCAVTGGAPNEVTIWFNMTNTGALSATMAGYVLLASSSGTSWAVRKYVNGSSVGNIATATAPAVIAGDSIWIAKRGNTYTVYRDRGGTGFFEILNFTDTASPSGQFAVEMSDATIRWEQVEGGPFAPVVPDNETLIDDFNRANGAVEAGAGASLWNASMDVWGDGATARPVIVSNQLAAQAAYGNIWSKLTLDRDFDLVFDFVVSPTNPAHFWAYLCVAGGGSNPTLNAYYLEWGNYVLVNSLVNGANVATLLNVGATPPASGDTVWIKKRGTLITLYRKPSGGNFAPVASFTSSAHDRAGGFALGISNQTTARIDNLRGGPTLVPVETIIDNFNRGSDYEMISDGVAGGNLWYPYGPAASQSVTAPYLVGNQMAGFSGKNYFSRSKFTMDKDFDLLLDCPVVGAYTDSFIIDFCLAGVGTDQWTGYRVRSGIGTNKWEILKRYDQGGGTYVFTQIAGSTTLSPVASGESLWLRKRGTKIQILRRPTSGAGNWVAVLEVTDTNYDRTGPIVVWAFSDNNGRFDNLRGGPVLLTIDVADSVTTSDSASLDFIVPLDIADTVTLSDSLVLTDFTPPVISGCVGWWDAADLGIAHGAAVSAWPNKAPGGFALSLVSSPAPVARTNEFGLKGLPITRFTAGQGAFAASGTGVDNEFTIVFVARMWGSNRQRIIGGWDATPNFLIGFWQTKQDIAFMQGWLSGDSTGVPADLNPKLYSADGTGAFTGRLFSDGTLIKGPTGGAGGWGGRISLNRSNGEYSDVEFAEVCFYNRKLSDAERQTVESYLREKWITPGAVHTITEADSVTTSDSPSFAQDHVLSATDTVTITESPTWDWTIAPADSVTTADSFDSSIPYTIDLADSVTLTDELTLADFSPAVIANCTHWFDAADDASFVYGTGRAVQEWHDKSGADKYVSQVTAAQQPTRTTPEFGRNGLPTVSFDGGDCLVRAGIPFNIAAVTVVMAFLETTHKDYAGVFTGYNNGQANDYDNAHSFALDTGSSTQQLFAERMSAAGAIISGASPSPFAIYAGVYRPDRTQQVYKNGTPGGSATTAVVTFGSPDAILLGARKVGGSINLSGYGLIGQIAEICVYDRVLNDAERQQLEAYLTTKWLIAGTAHTLNIADNVTVDDSSTFVQDQTLVAADTVTLSDSLARDQDFGLNPADSVTTSDSFTYLLDLGISPTDTVVLTDNIIWAQTFELFLTESDFVVVTDFADVVAAYVIDSVDAVVLTDLIELQVGLYFLDMVALSDSLTWEQTTPQVVVTVI